MLPRVSYFDAALQKPPQPLRAQRFRAAEAVSSQQPLDGGWGVAIINLLELYHKSPSSGERQYTSENLKRRFSPTLRAVGCRTFREVMSILHVPVSLGGGAHVAGVVVQGYLAHKKQPPP